MEFTKLSAPSLKDLFVQQLQGMILSGELPVGVRLPPERRKPLCIPPCKTVQLII